MPLCRLSGAEAIANIRSNPYAQWPSREAADENRIEPLCKPAFSPSFRLEEGEKIFTIGSCFARNVERALMSRGFDVVTSALAWPDQSVDTQGNGVLNNFGVVSIENEFRWALDSDHPFDPARHILQAAPGRYIDPHIPVRPAPLQRIMQYRAAITQVTRRVADCRVVVMTLGLSELWFDRDAQTYLNRAPPRMLVMRHQDRFEVHLLDFEDTMRSLEASVALLRAHCRTDQRILLTVSPVPLGSTHTDKDVLVVNSYSKSVLRTAAEHIAARHDHVDYFPSYESVMMSEREQTWEDDQVHVRQTLIRLNVERMLEAYMPSLAVLEPADVKRRLEEAAEEIAARNPQAAIALLEPVRQAGEIDAEFAVLYAELCLRLGRPGDARAAIAKLPRSAGDWRRALIEARIAIHDGDGEGAVTLLDALYRENPKSQAVLRARVDAFERLARWDDALLVLRRWSDLSRNAPEPYRRAALIHRTQGDAAAAERAFRIALSLSKATNDHVLDFIEFLIDQKRFAEAASELDLLRPESKATRRRMERMRAFLPTARAPSTSSG